MTKKMVFLAIAFLLLATPIFAQPAGAATTNGIGGKDFQLGMAYIAMGFASALCGLAQAKAVASSAEAMARNPSAQGGIRFALILGLVLIESLALYTLVITFIAQPK